MLLTYIITPQFNESIVILIGYKCQSKPDHCYNESCYMKYSVELCKLSDKWGRHYTLHSGVIWGAHQEPFSIGQSLLHPGSKEYCCEGQQRPRNQHEDPVSLQHPLFKGIDANIPWVSNRVNSFVTDPRNQVHVVWKGPQTCSGIQHMEPLPGTGGYWLMVVGSAHDFHAWISTYMDARDTTQCGKGHTSSSFSQSKQ